MIFIIVPTYGRINDTEKFIKSLRTSLEEDYILYLIDDHPDKVTFNHFKGNPKINVLKSGSELWWVGSINLGIKELFKQNKLMEDDIIIFANNDVVITRSCFQHIRDELKLNKAQIIHPRTMNQIGREISSGSKVICFFPFVAMHPKNFAEHKVEIDLGTARFLCTSGYTLRKVGLINERLVQYLGDNDFTLRAKKKHHIQSYILRDAICSLDDTETGMKSSNIKNVSTLLKSFISIKSPNNIKYRYFFFRGHFNIVYSFFIVLSLTMNSFVRFISTKMRKTS